ncbi:MAG: polysaccharide deacetylase family protein [Gammaproteobacteria bacterium]|nr:polysaccharide deacetylase family protein [Gammaproteobacteria bacterium]MBU0788322.1 polysaccharide deacetylase family protein [Gammaproteobacteria bacterium]MBU0815181.1 polysaccharide deacetylase family protein [Gammaproteobacteria bacterium]MBU1785711.1 polysaccharide deacetylase family protein [Gammaproteobacteria bacterium]
MDFLRPLLPVAYPMLRLSRLVRRVVPGAGAGAAELRVLLYHDIHPRQLDVFRDQLTDLSRRWKFITPVQFERVMRGEEPLRQDSLLLTFDDGFASNSQVAEQVLKPLGMQAIFFVVTEFVDQRDRLDARRFICDRLKAGTEPDALPEHWFNMGWTDLAHLIEQGHVVGAHTATHERLLSDVPEDVLRHEIINGADRLEDRLDVAVRHFAYPFGDFRSFSQQAMVIAKTRFDFVHSGLRGNNLPGSSSLVIRRDAVNTGDSHALIGAFLEGASDLRYHRAGQMLECWAK